jgi:uncharacterized damage-inducible protein DinB
MDPLIARYAEYLKKGRKTLLNTVADVSHDELHFTANGVLNSIAMLLKHAESAEWFLIHNLIAGDPPLERKTKPFEAGEEKLEDLVSALEKSLARTMQILADLPEDKLLTEKEIRLSSGPATVTYEWGILHTLEHEAQHIGQIILLKKLARAQSK